MNHSKSARNGSLQDLLNNEKTILSVAYHPSPRNDQLKYITSSEKRYSLALTNNYIDNSTQQQIRQTKSNDRLTSNSMPYTMPTVNQTLLPTLKPKSNNSPKLLPKLQTTNVSSNNDRRNSMPKLRPRSSSLNIPSENLILSLTARRNSKFNLRKYFH